MTNLSDKPNVDPASLRPTSARDRIMLDESVQITRKPDSHVDVDRIRAEIEREDSAESDG
jgi:hypothetical protein